MKKQSLERCLAEYSSKELIQLHANLNALFLCCTQDFHLFPLLMQVHLCVAQRPDELCKVYLKELDKVLNIPNEYKYAKNEP